MLLLRLSSASAVVAWVMQLFLADVILSGLLPISALLPSQCYNLSSHVAASVWSGVQWIFTRVNGARITVSGAEKLPKEESAIIISNHVEWTDFYMVRRIRAAWTKQDRFELMCENVDPGTCAPIWHVGKMQVVR